MILSDDDDLSSQDLIEIDLTVGNKHLSVSGIIWECRASFLLLCSDKTAIHTPLTITHPFIQ